MSPRNTDPTSVPLYPNTPPLQTSGIAFPIAFICCCPLGDKGTSCLRCRFCCNLSYSRRYNSACASACKSLTCGAFSVTVTLVTSAHLPSESSCICPSDPFEHLPVGSRLIRGLFLP